MRTRTGALLLSFTACAYAIACVPDERIAKRGPLEYVDIEPGNEFRNAAHDDQGMGEPPAGPAAGEGVAWMMFPAQQQRSSPAWGPVLMDIVNHLPSSYGDTYWDLDRITWAHGTTHGIHSYLRQSFNDSGRTANAFYVGDDHAIILPEPALRKSQVADFVPEPLRGPNFDREIVGATNWDDRPLYIFDEWVAYTNGGATGVDMAEHGLWTGGYREAVFEPLEFTVYALATAMAIEAIDPRYFEEQPQFKEFLAFQTLRALRVFFVGRELDDFSCSCAEQYLDELRNNAGAEPVRDFVGRFFGPQFLIQAMFNN